MKTFYQLILFFLFQQFSLVAFSQNTVCNLEVSPGDTVICQGDSVSINIEVSVFDQHLSDFNTSVLPTGWSIIGGASGSTNCLQSIDNSGFVWFEQGGTRYLESPAFDVSNGGTITFEMRTAINLQNLGCEGPDWYDEGINLLYSIDGGSNWISMKYYRPDASVFDTVSSLNFDFNSLYIYNSWNEFIVNIPVNAQTPSTKFKWTQPSFSGPLYDCWGLDNVSINGLQIIPPSLLSFTWNNGLINNGEFNVQVDSTTIFNGIITYGNQTLCTVPPFLISTYPQQINYSLPDTVFSQCMNSFESVTVNSISNTLPPYFVTWLESGVDSVTIEMTGNGNTQDTIVYHLQVSDACGYIQSDSVVYIIDQQLAIDSVTIYSATPGNSDGALVAYVSGITSANNYVSYTWTGPGANGATYHAAAWSNIPGGWYTFKVEDDVCSVEKSYYLDHGDLGINEFSLNESWRVYPNPANDVVMINLSGWTNGKTIFTLFNSQGQEVSDYLISQPSNDLWQVDLSGLDSGIYMVRLMNGAAQAFVKLVRN